MRGAGIVGPSLDAILDPALVEPDYDRLWSYRRFWREDLHPTVRLRWMELNTTLPDALLTKVDRSSMAHSLEVRPPLLDHRLAEFAFGLDPALLVDPVAARGKLVLRELVRDRLPSGHLDRPKKGFGLPVRRWLRQDPGVRDPGDEDAGRRRDPAPSGRPPLRQDLVAARARTVARTQGLSR